MSSPKTASPVTTFQNLNIIPQVLDLCTRRRDASSPKPEGAHQPHKNSPELPYLYNEDHHNFHHNNNNFMEHTPPPSFVLNQFQSTPIYRPISMKSDTDSSEEGSVKSDDFAPALVPNLGAKIKPTRPFKAYPKDPFFLALGACTADAVLGKESAEAYAEFRQKMLCQVRATNPEPGVTNTKMRRSTIPTSPQELEGKDASYWEKRKKNNEAAKRSRDARRAKEDELAIRAAFLEQENLKLKYEIAALRNENTKFRCLLYN